MPSVYTSMSKSLGWDEKEVSYPTIEEAKRLKERVISGDREAFYKVFELNRFASLDCSEEEFQVSNIIYDAFTEGSRIWREVEEPYTPSLED